MTETREVDVVIVGASLSGTALAAELAEQNVSAIVLQAGARPPAGGGEILKQGAITELESLRVLPGILERGALKRTSIRYFHERNLIVHSDYGRTPRGYFLIAPYQQIVAAVAEQATLNGAEIWPLAQVAEASIESDNVTGLTLRDGREISASTFVWTEKPNPRLSRWIGGEMVTTLAPHTLFTASAPARLEINENNMFFSSTGWFAYFYPLMQHVRVFLGVPLGADALDLAQHLDSIPSFVPDDQVRTATLSGAAFQRINISSHLHSAYHRGNAVLLGSAAWAAHPMTGQGMSHALRDARVLASCLARAGANHSKLQRLLAEDYEPRRALHERVVNYGNALASSYTHRDRYLHTFDWHMHLDAHNEDFAFPGSPGA